MRIEYKHNQTKEAIYQKLDRFLAELESQYIDEDQKLTISWNHSKDKVNFRFRASFLNTKGNIRLYDNKLILEGKLPLLTKPFERQAISIIKKTLEEILC